MSVHKWVKRKLALMAFALASAEKGAFGQVADALGNDESMTQTYTQGMLSDSLMRGEITLAVKELRWRLYKVLSESKNRVSHVVGYDDDGLPIMSTSIVDKYNLNKILRDTVDTYDVELVIYNEDITKSTLEAFKSSEYDKEASDTFDLVGEIKVEGSTTIGEISFNDMMSTFKGKKTIYVEREYRPKFEIEAYSKKLIVRNIDNETKLLEFYIPAYPDTYDRKTRLLITEIQRASKNPRSSDFLNINKVGFITDKCIGVPDGLEYEYDITSFDKIIEFNGSYVIKFLATVKINGDNIFEKYKEVGLEERYKNKKAK